MKQPIEVRDISGGISFYSKRSNKAFQVAWMRSVDYRTDPNRWTLLNKTTLESGSVVNGLVKFMERAIPRTDIPDDTTELLSNTSFEGGSTTGYQMDADFTTSTANAYEGTYSIKQVSTSGFANFYTDSSGITVEPYSDYLVSFRRNVSAPGLEPLFQVNTGSAFGSFIVGSYVSLPDTDGEWEETSVTINTGNNTAIWLRIFNNNGAVTAYYDKFSVTKIRKSSTYMYDDEGSLYERKSTGAYNLLKQVSESHGNGLTYFAEDDFVYYMRDTLIGRFGPLSYATPNLVDDFLGSEGGVPTNTHALNVVAASSHYADAADSASLSITDDLTIEAYVKPTSLPAVGERMAIVSKWDESGTLQSYILELYGISGSFGTGADGAKTVSTNETDAPIDSACSGTINTNTLYATNASFAVGQLILIHQTRGTGAGTHQKTKIAGYSAGVITTEDKLNFDYNSTGNNKAQVIVRKQYTNFTVNTGVTLTAKAWNGTVGGILTFVYNGTYSNLGTITASGKGFRGGAGSRRSNGTHATSGESHTGLGSSTTTVGATVPNNDGGGGNGGKYQIGSGGGSGGGFATNGGAATTPGTTTTVGQTYGTVDNTKLLFGSGGGGGYNDGAGAVAGDGKEGGGLIFITGPTAATGIILSNGVVGATSSSYDGGSGSGGMIVFEGQSITWGTVVALGGAASGTGGAAGGVGGDGRVVAVYLLSATGVTTPTYVGVSDGTLVTAAAYQIRLGVSSNGTNEEFLAKTAPLTVATYQRISVTFDASEATAYFYLDGILLGSATGTFTAIHNNASTLMISGYENSGGTKDDFFDGPIDDVRIFNIGRSTAQILANKDVEIAANTAGLVAYYQLDNSNADATANSNTLTLRNSVGYTTDVPFSAPTTRLDLDQSLDTSGNTYTLTTAINEGATHRQTFVPAKDPQKSIQILFATLSTGNVTLTVHDALNRVVASKTVSAANLNTGDFEFIFDDEWRPVVGATYHFHVTSTVADGTLTTTTASDLETADFHTYYQFLVRDDVSHMSRHFLNFLAICNGRYLAKLQAGPVYEPMKLTFPAGYRTRCLGEYNEYLAIGCYRGQNIYDFEDGYIFFWDGTKTTYNFCIKVPEGGINAMYGSGGSLYFVAGYQGDVLVYTGGAKARKLFRLPKMSKDKYMEVLPGAIHMWQALLRLGYGVSNSEEVERGVYTYGHVNDGEDDSLSYDYPVSTGNRTNDTLQIGCIYPIDRKLLISFKDGTRGGVDVVSPDADCFSSGTIELMVRDEGSVSQDKQIQLARADFVTLESGQSMTMKYRRDRAETWQSDTAITSSSSEPDKARFNVDSVDSRMREYQIGVDIATTSGISPEILSITAGIEPLNEEAQL